VDLLGQMAAQTKKRRESIQRKVHPALPLILRHYREALEAVNALGSNAPQELLDEIGSRNVAELRKSLTPWKELPTSLLDTLYLHLPEPVTTPKALAAFLHFQRHGRSLMHDLELANRKDYEAWKRLIRTDEDLAIIICGTGRVKPSKMDQNHADVMLHGIGLGLEHLTSEELADFMNEHCWCGKEHDADALKKQRGRIMQKLGVRKSSAPR
jgi:hypothetical protein